MRVRIVLLGEQPDVVAQIEQPLKDFARLFIPALQRKIVCEPEGAYQKCAFARRQPLRPETFDVGSRLVGLATMLDTLTGARIRVVTTKPECPCFVHADASQFDTAIVNLAIALLALGEWDAAERALRDIRPEGAPVYDYYLRSMIAWLLALRGRPDEAEPMLDAVDRFKETEDPQDLAMIATTRAFIHA